MAELSQRQQDRISKSSSDRLRSQLVRSGLEEGEVAQMERTELKSVAAQVEAGRIVGEEDRQKTLPDDGEELFEPSGTAASRSQEYQVLKLKLELRKLEIEAEREARKMELEAQLERQRMETELRMAEMKARAQNGVDESGNENLEGTMLGAPQAIDNSLAGRTKRFGDALRHVLPHMPSEHAELPQFFDTVEKLFKIYQVPADVQGKLLIPILSTQAKTIIGRMTSDDLESYDKVKQFLLSEFRLTPKQYKLRFDTATKGANETYVLFASRLCNLLT